MEPWPLCLLFRKELEKIITPLSSRLPGGALAASARWQAGDPAPLRSSLSLPLPLRGESTCHRPAVSEGDTKACFGSGGEDGGPRLSQETETQGWTLSSSPDWYHCFWCVPHRELDPRWLMSSPPELFVGGVPSAIRTGSNRLAGGGRQGLAQGHSDSTELMHTQIGLLLRQGGLQSQPGWQGTGSTFPCDTHTGFLPKALGVRSCTSERLGNRSAMSHCLARQSQRQLVTVAAHPGEALYNL